ncbi:MAG: T9SS type A sorting domain-containing protein [Bacteroidetes bacterium]|nr:T9SS type A sorting domain-containing protein [Bacteroidota bacterium]
MNRTVFMLIMFVSASHAQWSTSTIAESTLYVCPGFYPGIVTFDDGGSIVLGALDSYIFARKLDPYGYYQWPPVQVHYHDSSFITETIAIGDWGGWISDADGGVILFWYDHRGSYRGTFGFENNGIYVQRVDRFGVPLWTPGGILVKGPQTGRKKAGIVGDGQGGFFLAWTDFGFGYPGAPNKSNLSIAHFNQDAVRLWEIAIDSSSSLSDVFSLNYLMRGGNRLYMSYFASYIGNSNFHRIVDIAGNLVTHSRIRIWKSIKSERDSVTYFNSDSIATRVFKVGTIGDTLWITNFDTISGCQNIDGFVPDGLGGAYFLNVCGDSVVHINSQGLAVRKSFMGINFGAQAFSDGYHGMVLANATTAKRFNNLGTMIWPSAVVYLQDPGNAYFPLYVADKNGGIISAFWTTLGGIFAQHTGRSGSVGIITSVPDPANIPVEILLDQNYPNPFNPATTISFSIPSKSFVSLKVFDALGREVTVLLSEELAAGTYAQRWNAEGLASGVYFYRLQAGSFVETKKLLLLR